MKRVISGKEYDTKTAELIHGPVADEFSFTETLYRSPKGQLFVVTISEDIGHSSSWKLVSLEGAEEWLDRHGAPRETYEALGITVEVG